MRDAHKGLALVCASDGVKFAGLDIVVDSIEILGHHIYAAGVAYQDYAVAELFGSEMDVERAPVIVDD